MMFSLPYIMGQVRNKHAHRDVDFFHLIFTTTDLHLFPVLVSPFLHFSKSIFKKFGLPHFYFLSPYAMYVTRHPSLSFSFLCAPHLPISVSCTPTLAQSTQDLHISLSVPEDNASETDPLVPAKGLGALLWVKTLQ